MGTQSTTYPTRRFLDRLPLFFAAVVLLGAASPGYAQTISALTVPLLLPASVSFDAQGNLYVAETDRHVIRKVDPTGVLTTVAGNGTQGFSGDGGPATLAALDSPAGIAVDGAQNLYIADAHNHRIRRVDGGTGVISTVAGDGVAGFSGDGGAATLARLNLPSSLALDGVGNLYLADTNNHRLRRVALATGVIATVAGNGLQGFSGDGGAAAAAAIDSPGGVAVDTAGNLYLADTHNHRVRVVSATTGRIATVAGTGVAAFAGDNGTAASAALALPRGVSVDNAGNLYIADTNNQRLRRISPQGTITTVAGNGTQGFLGDGGPAVAASLDTPRATALSPAGLLTMADTGNERVRQVGTDAGIVTIAGLGGVIPAALTLAAPPVVYGAGSLTATLATASPATGSVTFIESTASGMTTLGSAALASNAATLSTTALPAATHSIFSTYPGDLTHAAARSMMAALMISPAPLTASASAASILYGQSVPALTGTLTGVLTQDVGKVSLALSTTASALSPPGVYPVTGKLSGAAAGNYALTPFNGAVLTIAKAPSAASLLAASSSLSAGSPLGVTVQVASTTAGVPTGSISLLDGSVLLAVLPLSATGTASYAASGLVLGSHALSATYAGDANFTGSTTAATTIAVLPVLSGDFVLAATGLTSQTVPSGSAASFAFAVQMQGAALSSPITLAAASLPAGVTASFSPAYLPPGGATAFTLTLQTSKAAASKMHALPWAALALLLPFGLRWRRVVAASGLLLVVAIAGCGDRIFTGAATATATSAAVASYPITVSATATDPSGTALLHTATVTLIVQ